MSDVRTIDGWIVTISESRPDRRGRYRQGALRIKAHDPERGRVINTEVMPEHVESFDPERTWQIILANRPLFGR